MGSGRVGAELIEEVEGLSFEGLVGRRIPGNFDSILHLGEEVPVLANVLVEYKAQTTT